MKKRTQQLIKELSEIFEGQPWYGQSVMRKLENVPYELGYKTCVPESHSVAEIVAHLTEWKKFVVEKLNNNSEYDIETDSENDWPKVEIHTQEEWEELKRKLVAQQSQIYEYLENTDDDSYLQDKVGGRDYTKEYLLRGVVQHDIYHLGQVGLIESQIKRKRKDSGIFRT